MSVTATKPTGYRDGPAGSLKQAVRDLTFANNYQDDGSETTLTAAQCGMKRMFMIIPQGGMMAASALTTANPIAVTLNAAGTSAEITLYEDLAVAAAAPLAEKTDNEAFLTGQTVRVLVIGH